VNYSYAQIRFLKKKKKNSIANLISVVKGPDKVGVGKLNTVRGRVRNQLRGSRSKEKRTRTTPLG
jgi:hypothetical protein